MTRLNLLPPEELSNQHLFAEVRELPRVFSYVRKYGIPKNIPHKYTMGSGHVKFFANKLNWLLDRYCMLYEELLLRGYNLSNTPQELISKYEDLFVQDALLFDSIDWSPSEKEYNISLQRIQEKIRMKPEFYTWNIVK